eukprot:6444990-Alexandrium_andersonii.AAC.1
MHPSGGSGTRFEAAPGPAQFKLRAPDAVLHVPHGGLRIEGDCSTDWPSADFGVDFGQCDLQSPS